MKPSEIFSLIALVVSVVTFVITQTKEWRKKPRLNIFLRLVRYVDKKDPSLYEEMVTILLINDGHSPIIISQCEYLNEQGGKGNLGIYDELKAPYGVADIVLPVLLGPAEKFTLNFVRSAAINKINEITLIDSHGKKYKVPAKELANVKAEYKRRLAQK